MNCRKSQAIGANFMAQRQLVQLGCDLDDGKVTSSVQTVTFGYGGGLYELELCGKHRKPLADLLTELVGSGRKVGASKTRPRTQPRPVSQREENAEIRSGTARLSPPGRRLSAQVPSEASPLTA